MTKKKPKSKSKPKPPLSPKKAAKKRHHRSAVQQRKLYPMYGIFINGARPKSKKEIKALAADISKDLQESGWHLKPRDGYTLPPSCYSLVFEATSMFGNEFDGSLAAAMAADGGDPAPTLLGRGFTFVGPDPYRNRKFYGTVSFDAKKVTINVT